MTEEPNRYHHGDLRAALLAAAEAELAEHGVEGFSLRGVAKRAGVSHAAPAHHFRDTAGLLTALAALAFERFLATQRARQSSAAPDGLAQLAAAGLGYVDFACAHPALFRLMFASDRPDFTDPELSRAAMAAFSALEADIHGATGADPATDATARAQLTGAWAIAHGFADLLQSGRFHFLTGLSEGDRDALFVDLVTRAIGR